MSLFTKQAAAIFAGYDSGGTARQIIPVEAQTWGTEVERIIDVAIAAGNLRLYTTKAELDADLDHVANTAALVLGDSAVNDGLYKKVGASGAGSWPRVGDVPGYSFVLASNAGAGTANAIVATTSLPTNESQLIALPIDTTNTGTPVTVAFNGGSALTIKTSGNNDVSIGGLVAGGLVAGYVNSTEFRLLSDQASSAIQTASENAQSYAEEWANKAEDSLVSSAAGGDQVDDYSAKHWAAKAEAQAGGVADGAVTDIKVATPATPADGVAASKIRNSFPSSPAVHRDLDTVLNGVRYINVNRFGVDGTGDTADMTAWQDALDEGVPLTANPGTYIINDPLTYNTTAAEAPGLIFAGPGQNAMTFDWRGSSAFMLSMNAYDSPGNTFQRGTRLSGFKIKPSSAGTTAGGIYARAIWDAQFDNITIDGVSGDGLKYEAGVPPGDPDSSGLVDINQLRCFNCGGFGADFLSANSTIGIAQFIVRNSGFNGNTSEGQRIRGSFIFKNVNNFYTGNTAGGAIVDYNSVDNQMIGFEYCEFGNSNGNYDLFVRAGHGVHITDNVFTHNSGDSNPLGIKLGLNSDPSGVSQVDVARNRFRVDSSINPFTAYTIQDNVSDVTIRKTFWHIFGASGQTDYSIDAAAKGITIEDEGLTSRGFASATTTSATPDLDATNTYRIQFGAALTVNAPTVTRTLLGGERFNLHLVNTSGGALTPTFNAVYLTVAPLVGSSKRRTCWFEYDPLSAVWVQVGDWSPDL